MFALLMGLAWSGTLYGEAGDRIAVDGSTGMAPLVRALAQAYQAQNPGVTVEVGKGMGTGARIRALAEEKIDIAMASHGLNVEEITRQGMAVHEIAKVAVVFGVNASVPVAELTERQVCDIYALRLKDWSELGKPSQAIAVLTRPETEVDTEVVRARIGCLKELQIPESVKVMPKAGEMAAALASTTGAIGMTTMTVVEQSGGRVRQIALNGVAPSAENVQKGAYALTRDSFLITRTPASPAVVKFLEFVRSPAGVEVISTNGAVPVK
jgi:phosphate transport system substrate-binding protein